MAAFDLLRKNGIEKQDITIREIEDFLYLEAQLLDERRFEEWDTLFTEDGYYWVPARPDQPNPLDEVSIYFDDRETRQIRIARLRHPQIHVQTPPSRTCHLVTNVRLEASSPENADYLVSSALLVVEYRKGEQRTFAARCQHALRFEEGLFKIFWKRVNLINADDAFTAIAIFF